MKLKKILKQRTVPSIRASSSIAESAATPVPKIRDAYTDQHGKRWVQYGFVDRSFTFAMEDFVRKEIDVVASLVNIGALSPSPKSKADLRTAIATEREFPIRHVADRCGWATDECFIFGDGTLAMKPGSKSVPISIKPDARFSARGSLAAWQTGMGSLIAHHPIIASMHALALAGVFMRFIPADITNPIVELSSGPGKGKTTLGIGSAAVWGDDPASTLGMATSFNATTNAVEDRQHETNDMLLMIDEVNLAESGGRAGEGLADIVLRLERGAGRRRHGDFNGISSRGTRLITANRPLASYIKDDHKRAAVASRIVTLVLAPSIFDGPPKGFPNEQAAAEHMLSVARANGGIVGRSLIENILARPWKHPGGLRGLASGHMEVAREELVDQGLNLPSRAQNAFAMMIMAAKMATAVGVFNLEWHVADSVMEVARRYAGAPAVASAALSESDRIREYLTANGFAKPNVQHRGPVLSEALRQMAGVEYFTRAGERMIAIHPDVFREAFPQDHLKIMQAARTAGLAQSEGGEHPRLSIKAPNSVCAGERVNSFRVDLIIGGQEQH